MNAALLFASTFFLVFMLGLQSLCVNRGQYWLAFANSFGISLAQLFVLRLAPDASALDLAGYFVGGPLGIVCSMLFHRHFLHKG